MLNLKQVCYKKILFLIICVSLFLNTAAAKDKSDPRVDVYNKKSFFKLSLYSESLYDDRFDGAVTETRIRLIPRLKYSFIEPYFGITFSQDLSNGDAPILIENMIAPTLGIRLRVLSFLYLFSEYRYLNRFNNDLRTDSDDEFRYGLFAYKIWFLKNNFFNEVYSEIVSVDRVSKDPVAMLWNKLGYRKDLNPWLRTDFYLEGFFKKSPDLGYGPSENELRTGFRAAAFKGYWGVNLILNYSPLSDVEKNGVDFLLVISREEF